MKCSPPRKFRRAHASESVVALFIITSLYLWKFHSLLCLVTKLGSLPPLFSKPVAPPPLRHTPGGSLLSMLKTLNTSINMKEATN